MPAMTVRGRFAAFGAALAVAVLVAVVGAAAALADHDGGAPHTPGDPDRRFELVSPPYKLSGNGIGSPGRDSVANAAKQAGSAAYVGDRFPVGAHAGAILLDGESATASDWALAERASDGLGWLSHSPVTHAFQGPEYYRMLFMEDAAPDYSTIMWTGNAGDLPFFEQAAALEQANNGSLLLSDWGDPPASPTRWEPIAPLDASQRPDSFDWIAATLVFLVPAISADGSHVAASGKVRGLAGAGGFGCTLDGGVWTEVATGDACPDPTVDTVGIRTQSAYVDDVSAGLSDAWPGAGVRVPAALCTGAGGARTALPARDGADGSLGAVACEAGEPDRDGRLVSDYGSAITWHSGSPAFIGTSASNVISEDGSRTFFMAPDPSRGNPGTSKCVGDGVGSVCPTQLFVRQENGDGEVVTRWVSRPDAGLLDGPGEAGLLGPAYFEGASADGSRVFFRTDSPLTADDPNGGEACPPPSPATECSRSSASWDLYMFELASGSDPTGPGSRLTRITAGPSGSSDCSAVPDSSNSAALRFSSEDGKLVYFSCAAPLGGVADRPELSAVAGAQGGTPSTPDQTNVYLYDGREPDPAERYTFVARIPRAISGDSTSPEPVTRCASAAGLRGGSVLGAAAVNPLAVNCWRGSGDGAFATFFTLGQLFDDDDSFGVGGVGASADIYGYDADSDEVVRVSGSQHSSVDETYSCGHLAAGFSCYADQGLHEASNRTPGAANPLLNVVSGAGGVRTVFFESASRLVDGDVNGVMDVYRWRDGVLSLVSSGAAGSDGAAYKGNSVDGENVFLATRDRLTWQDVDSVLDVYVARAGSQGIPRPPQPPVCGVLAGVCHGSGAAAVVPAVPRTSVPAAGGDASPVPRARLAIRRPGRRALRRAARRGVLRVRVRTSRPGVLRAGARARLGRRSVKVAGTRKRVASAGRSVVRLRLSRRARRVLGQGRRLRVTIRVAQSGALTRSATVHLKRGSR